MANLEAVPQRYRHLVQSTWDVEFLAKPSWVEWLDTQVQHAPLAPGELLVDYVRTRVNSQKDAAAAAAAPAPAPSPPTFSSAPPPAVAPTVQTDYGLLTGDGFDDPLDLNSYAADDPSTTNGFGDDAAAFSAAYPVTSSYGAFASTSGASASPISTYSTPGALAPFSQHLAYSGPITPFTPHSRGSTPTSFGQSSTLALQTQLINEERARAQAAAGQNGGAGVSGSFLQPTTAGAFFDPRAFQQPPQATFTITPAVLSTSAAPIASTSTSTSPSSSSKPARSSSSSTSTKRSRTASPVVDSYDSSQWTSLLPKIRQHLTPKRLQGAALSTAQQLVKHLALFNHTERASTLSPWGDASDVPPEGRAEVLTAALKYAKDDFWRAWLDVGAPSSSASSGAGKGKEKESSAANAKGKSDGLGVLQYWLDGAGRAYSAAAAKDKEKDKDKAEGKKDRERERRRRELEQTTLALVLQALLKLPVAMDHLLVYGSIPKLVKRIAEKAPDGGAVKGAAVQLFTKWMKLQEEARKTAAAAASSSSSAASKRKSDAADAPAKKPKTDDAKKKPATAALPVKKVALPSFTKTAPAAPANPFLAGMKGLQGKSAPAEAKPVLPSAKKIKPAAAPGGGRSMSPVEVRKAPVAAAAHAEGAEDVKPAANGGKKKKKTVRWKPDEELVAIREIEKAVYEDDENAREAGARLGEGSDVDANRRDMDMQEGQTLHMHLDEEMDEDIEFYPPIPITIPDTEDFAFLRQEPVSAELAIQTEREASLMAVDAPDADADADPSAEPPIPGEAPEYAPAEPDAPTKVMLLGKEIADDDSVVRTIALAQAQPRAVIRPAYVPFEGTEPMPMVNNDQLASILGQLSSSSLDLAGTLQALQPVQPVQQQARHPALDDATLAMFRNYHPEQVDAILRSNPQFAGITLEMLGLAPPAHAQQQQGQGYAPPPAHQAYGQPWQPAGSYAPPAAASSAPAWPPQPNYTAVHAHQHAPPPGRGAYDGYVPPAQPQPAAGGGRGPTLLGPGGKKNVPCRFWYQPRGCDRGEMCAFRHDGPGRSVHG
ncbi:hypothetical protein JCM10207_000905 [Rhodosporidiobolus poonsookiae]